MTDDRRSGDLRLYLRLLSEARPSWPHISGLLLLSLLAAPLALLTPLPLKIVVDSAIGAHPLPDPLARLMPGAAGGTDVLLLALALMMALAIMISLRSLAASTLETHTGERLVLRFRARLLQQVQRLSFAYHDRIGIADSIYRIQYDALSIQWVAVQGVIPFITAAFTLAGMVWVIIRIDVDLALIALAISPILFLITVTFRGRLRREWSKVKGVESSAMSALQESLGALRVVKAFGQEAKEEERFLHRSELGVRGKMRLAVINGGFDGLIAVTIAGGSAAALYIGVSHVQSGALTLGNLLLVMAYLGQLYGPLQMMNRKLVDLQASMASAERAFAVLDETPDVVQRPHALPLPRARGEIVFRGVSFAYPGGVPVLHDISFAVDAGARVGIIGPTGAGKTTLISLIMRFYDPSSGHILLDGRDLRDYRLGDLRNQFAIVPQEPLLFSTSVAENISYARPDADHDAVVRAARAAGAHDFIMGLPDAYDTLVGERGMMLSGGERQRVALARAFLKDAPALILDEPTSSVDPDTERAILSSMRELMRDRTSFMIAHRPGTLANVDLLLRIDTGHLTVLPREALVVSSGLTIDASAGYRRDLAAQGGQHASTLPGIQRP